MAKKQARNGNVRAPKAVLRLPDLDLAKSAVLNSPQFARRSTRATGMQSRNSLNGIAQSLGCRSTKPSFYAIACTLSLGIWRQALSTSDLARSGDLRTRRLIADC